MRTECSGQALNCLFFLAVKGPSCRIQKGTPYGVGVHVDETGCLLPGVGVYVGDRLKFGWASEVSKGGVGGVHRGQVRRANPEPGGGGGNENEWCLGCCDASDVIDGE